MQISDSVKESYSSQYDESSIAWCNTGAKYKALNTMEVAKNVSFKNILEIVAGEGSILNWFSRWDFYQDMNCVEILESGIGLIKSKSNDILLIDGYKIPYPDSHFDLVICSHEMEHVEHERLLLREIKRVSKNQIFEVRTDFSILRGQEAETVLVLQAH